MNKHVLLFDSGVGGLSVLQEIKSLLPSLQLSYLFDNAYFPYGELEENTLISRVGELIQQAIAQLSPDLIVIACNSASTLALPSLRERFSLPFVGVVPAIKTAASLSQTKHFAVLATPGTVMRSYTKDLIAEFASGNKVDLLGSTRLVEMAEGKLHGDVVSLSELRAELGELAHSASLDSVVLGCTHFPLLREELGQVLGERVSLVDSGAAIARRVKQLLPEPLLAANIKKEPNSVAAYATAPFDSSLLDQLQGFGVDRLSLF